MSLMARRRALRLGWQAESLAVLLLRLKGWQILARRFNVPGGEVDIIARRGSIVIFVEVKARATPEAALAAIDGVKRRRLRLAARRWLIGKDWALAGVLRCDAILVMPRRWPQHIADIEPLGP
ncbi:MAG: YraN family protein [Hyphomicrobiales bacterium]|nr:YraN family protein [Hyphomicrobiales bacterium]